jgi:hypothetical protein
MVAVPNLLLVVRMMFMLNQLHHFMQVSYHHDKHGTFSAIAYLLFVCKIRMSTLDALLVPLLGAIVALVCSNDVIFDRLLKLLK